MREVGRRFKNNVEQEETNNIESVQEKSTNIEDMQCGLNKWLMIGLKLTLRVPFSFNTQCGNENLNQWKWLSFSLKHYLQDLFTGPFT